MEEIHGEHQDMETQAKESQPAKEVRRRKKRLLHQIANQMDFYFSAANINKDRFMGGLMRHGPYITLETFFKFNKIRSMTSDLDFLRKAISKTTLLELSEDGLMVRRKEAAQPKENELQCTIYVENVPSNADHEWVREVFGEYGTIDYISLPRYHRSGRPKGFAFVEFKTPEMANSALEAFGALECKIPTTTDPAELQSIRAFAVEGQGEGEWKGEDVIKAEESVKKRKFDVNEKPEEKKIKEDTEEEKKTEGKKRKLRESEEPEEKTKEETDAGIKEEGEGGKKRKLRESEEPEEKKTKEDTDEGTEKEEKAEGKKRKLRESEETNGKKTKEDIDAGTEEEEKTEGKKRKLGESEGPEGKKTKEESKEEENTRKRKLEEGDGTNKKKRKTSEAETKPEETMEEGNEGEQTDTEEKKKKKKKKRKRKKKEEKEVIDSIYLRVMSKEDWKKLRNKYLNTQRENMKLLKRQVQERYYQSHAQRYMPERSTEQHTYTQRDNIGRTQRTEKDERNSQSEKPQFTPNSIIKISFEEPLHDVKKLRETIREGGGKGVAYVDLSATERDVYVRFTSSEAADAYRTTGCWSRMEMLTGEEEEEYWRRIVTCWSERRNKRRNAGRGQGCAGELRGREKLLQKAFRDAQNTKYNTHIVFDD